MNDEQEVRDALASFESNSPKERDLSGEQQHAVELCCDLNERIVGITGGAGVGKTLVLGHVHKELKTRRRGVALCAPTGRAAKRIQELTGIKAKTVHRLLEFPLPDEEGDPTEPKRNRQNPLVEKVVIVDEASMLSPLLFDQLMAAIPRDGVVRFFGDNNQLPPVEDDKIPPFFDVIERFPSVILTFNFRNDDMIIGNAARILSGRVPIRNAKFEIIYCNDPIKKLLSFVTKDFLREDHQIIMPTRKGKYGTVRTNPSLQMRFNPRGPALRLDRFNEDEAKLILRAEDKFLWIKNDYKMEMFNGEIGKVTAVDPEDGTVELLTDNREVIVPSRVKTYSAYHGSIIQYDPRKQIELGYAITTHKAQGSEFETIIYCISRGAAFLLNRRNLYTAITRAKKLVIIIAEPKAMGLSMRRHQVDTL
jgi:exodeoxyribonuclease V alpha subunit